MSSTIDGKAFDSDCLRTREASNEQISKNRSACLDSCGSEYVQCLRKVETDYYERKAIVGVISGLDALEACENAYRPCNRRCFDDFVEIPIQTSDCLISDSKPSAHVFTDKTGGKQCEDDVTTSEDSPGTADSSADSRNPGKSASGSLDDQINDALDSFQRGEKKGTAAGGGKAAKEPETLPLIPTSLNEVGKALEFPEYADNFVKDSSLDFYNLVQKVSAGARYEPESSDGPWPQYKLEIPEKIKLARIGKGSDRVLQPSANDPSSTENIAGDIVTGQTVIFDPIKDPVLKDVFGKFFEEAELGAIGLVIDIATTLAEERKGDALRSLDEDERKNLAREDAQKAILWDLATQIDSQNPGPVESNLNGWYRKGKMVYEHNDAVLRKANKIKKYPCIKQR